MIAPIPKDIPDLPAVPGMPTLLPSDVPAAAVMTPVRRPVTAAYRLLVALATAAAVALDLVLGPSPVRVLSYFTIQTGVLVAPVFALSAWRAWTARRPLPPLVTGGTLFYTLIAGLLYHVVLVNEPGTFSMTGPTDALTGWPALANQILHTATPAAALLDWLLLTHPAPLGLRHATRWLLYPVAYLIFSLTRGALIPQGREGRYLYPFLDAGHLGYKSVLGNALLLGLAFFVVALLLVAADHVRPDPIRRRPKTGFRLQPPVG